MDVIVTFRLLQKVPKKIMDLLMISHFFSDSKIFSLFCGKLKISLFVWNVTFAVIKIPTELYTQLIIYYQHEVLSYFFSVVVISCRPQMGLMLAPWTLLSGYSCLFAGTLVLMFRLASLTSPVSLSIPLFNQAQSIDVFTPVIRR